MVIYLVLTENEPEWILFTSLYALCQSFAALWTSNQHVRTCCRRSSLCSASSSCRQSRHMHKYMGQVEYYTGLQAMTERTKATPDNTERHLLLESTLPGLCNKINRLTGSIQIIELNNVWRPIVPACVTDVCFGKLWSAQFGKWCFKC